MKFSRATVIGSILACVLVSLVLYSRYAGPGEKTDQTAAMLRDSNVSSRMDDRVEKGKTNSQVAPKLTLKDEVYSVPSLAVFDEQQNENLKEFEKELNRLTQSAQQVRLKIAAAKSSRLRSEPKLAGEMQKLKQLESEFESALQSHPDVQRSRVMREEARKVYDQADAHHATLLESADKIMPDSNVRDWKECQICSSIVQTLPPHGPSSHAGVASIAKERARSSVRDASANFVGVQREIKVVSKEVRSKWDEALALRESITGTLDQFPEVTQLVEKEKQILAEHDAIRQKCRKIHQSARREPVQAQQSVNALLLGSGS